jgi:hypothetical protein
VIYGDREAYTKWFTIVDRPSGTDFVQNATHTYVYNDTLPVAERPLGYRQDFGPNRRPQSGAVS